MGETGSQLYHVTHIRNLRGIFATALVCRKAASRRAGWTQFPGVEEHLRKQSISLTGREITDYVPLSFCLDSPFLYGLTDEASSWGQRQHRRGYHAPADNDDIAILCLDGAGVFDLDGAIYTDGDDRSWSVDFYESCEVLSHVDWSAVTASTCLDENVENRKAAEVLVPGFVPSRLITSVILFSHLGLEYVQDVLCDLADKQIEDDGRFARFMNILKVRPDVYFPQYADSDAEPRRDPTARTGAKWRLRQH
jgi:hypothetical protein